MINKERKKVISMRAKIKEFVLTCIQGLSQSRHRCLSNSLLYGDLSVSITTVSDLFTLQTRRPNTEKIQIVVISGLPSLVNFVAECGE